ncbi:hypothetical protein BFL35_14805 [Clavibacter michiganensis]|nr:hypothetical protein BFL35_14805 [Clavibacter michiganensis]
MNLQEIADQDPAVQLIEDKLILIATGEDVTKLYDPNHKFYGVYRNIAARVGHDPSKLPGNVWSGSVRALATLTGIPLKDLCAEFGYSEEAIADDLNVEMSVIRGGLT